MTPDRSSAPMPGTGNRPGSSGLGSSELGSSELGDSGPGSTGPGGAPRRTAGQSPEPGAPEADVGAAQARRTLPRGRHAPGRADQWLGLGPAGLIAGAVVALVGVAVFWPTLLAGGDPLAIAPAQALQPPGPGHWFGTDVSGRDVYTRVIHGARQSVGIGLSATAIGATGGLVIGLAAGLGPRWLDAALRRVMEVLFALPTLVLALLLVAVIGPGVRASVLAIGLATAPGYARILRARVRSIAGAGYVQAARLQGIAPALVLIRHVLPHALWPLLAVVTLGIGQAIVWVAALSFLGLGALPPSAEWGAMVNDGRLRITTAWWLTLGPGLAITLTAAALTVLGRAIGRVR